MWSKFFGQRQTHKKTKKGGSDDHFLFVFFKILKRIVVTLFHFVIEIFVEKKTHYKQTALGHLQLSKDYLEKLKRVQVPAQKQILRLKAEKYRTQAMHNLKSHFRKNPHEEKLDLHYFTLKEVRGLVEAFLEYCFKKNVLIITGRGLHSENNIPKIKPEVEKILIEKNLKYSWINDGCLMVEYTYDYLSGIKHFLGRLLFR